MRSSYGNAVAQGLETYSVPPGVISWPAIKAQSRSRLHSRVTTLQKQASKTPVNKSDLAQGA